MKRKICALLIGAFILSCGCSSTEETTKSSETSSTTTTEATTASSETTLEETVDTSGSGQFYNPASTTLYQAYYTLLYMVKEYQNFPEDYGRLDMGCDEDISESQFSVFDVDGDGTDELLLRWMCGGYDEHALYVFEYDTEEDKWNLELQTETDTYFYDNGISQEMYFDDEGYQYSVPPYRIYRYDEETDLYTLEGSVDSMDRQECERRGGPDTFPYDSDTDDDGIVLMIDHAGYDEGTFYQDADYQEFYEEIFGDSSSFEIEWYNLTQEDLEGEFTGR